MRLNQIPDRMTPAPPQDRSDVVRNGGGIAIALAAAALGGTPNNPPSSSGMPISKSAGELAWPGQSPQTPQKIQTPNVPYIPGDRIENEKRSTVTRPTHPPKPVYAPFRNKLQESIVQGPTRVIIKQPRPHN